MSCLSGLRARFRAVNGAAIMYPHIGRDGHIWTDSCHFFSGFLDISRHFAHLSSNLLNFLNQSHPTFRHMPC